MLSVSRATDIPALYSEWFFNRLEEGYCRWRNPFNGTDCYVSFQDVRFIVFWSKNPDPLLPYLERLRERGILMAASTATPTPHPNLQTSIISDIMPTPKQLYPNQSY
ncbi:MAG: DUF1848 domain-containing protein [Muribaculaceae bacterium]|nr:DUF1848 domain-containing protein [Muribaculaceae bacterium]